MQLLHDLAVLINDVVILTRPFVEWLFFVSGTVLCFIAFRGLKQIDLLKADMLARSERSAKEKAIEACQKYLGEFTVEHNRFIKFICAKGLNHYDGPIGEFKVEEINKFAEASKKRYELQPDWVLPLNKLEAIAAMFVAGVADEQTGFEAIGWDFVDLVRTHYDLYTMSQTKLSGGKQYYSNTIKLFKVWSPRFTEKELILEKMKLEERISRLDKTNIQALKPKI